jgi:hypothetical protein
VTDPCEVSFTATVGATKRGQFKRAMRAYCWSNRYELQIDEDKGRLESVLRFRLTVPSAEATNVSRELNAWLRELSK